MVEHSFFNKANLFNSFQLILKVQTRFFWLSKDLLRTKRIVRAHCLVLSMVSHLQQNVVCGSTVLLVCLSSLSVYLPAGHKTWLQDNFQRCRLTHSPPSNKVSAVVRNVLLHYLHCCSQLLILFAWLVNSHVLVSF